MSSLEMLTILSIIAILYLVVVYNTFVRLRSNVKESWSDIEVQMKRRYNLIPNLVETVKGYAKHESETLEKVINARSAAMNNQGSPSAQAKDENILTGALKSIFALGESYPDLKASRNFLELQQELIDTEDKIQASRRFYNSNVRNINISVKQFPKNVVAKLFKFGEMDYFELDESEKMLAGKPTNVHF